VILFPLGWRRGKKERQRQKSKRFFSGRGKKKGPERGKRGRIVGGGKNWL